MKKTIFAAIVLASSSMAFAGGIAAGVSTTTAGTAVQVCDGGGTAGKTTVNGGPGNVIGTTAVFTRNGFDTQCSANVFMDLREESPTLAAVAAGSAKGNQVVAGNSNGGAILPGGDPAKSSDAKCTGTNGACTTTDVTRAMTNSIALGGT